MIAVLVPTTFSPGQPAAASAGDWSLTDCLIGERPPTWLGPEDPGIALRAKWHIHNLDPDKAHSYTLQVVWGDPSERLGRTWVNTDEVGAGESRTFDIEADATSETADRLGNGVVPCEIVYLRDDDNRQVTGP
ncbi:hypothetical protein QEZ54_20375 [Catellatospora sp. KI3]|uniref:hypothetical protein n=1 Tax=Catellatospora sp. KI3 TaxID=3041620 RepID=UPI002482EE87|nr:hypothetical protein [Catellatospora sp. KI3]MDI1463342.1 hypothetical protein [Catellatospora sp. KI3]